jgi:tetratricopeptide (TPR) repeat protein
MPYKEIPIPRAARVAVIFLLVALSAGVVYLLAASDREAADYVRFAQFGSEDAPIPSNYAKAWGDYLLLGPDSPQIALAAAHYRDALLLSPIAVVHWRDWAEANRQLERTDVARKALEAAEFLAPNDQDIQMEFGNLFLAQGSPEDAVGHHRRALETAPSLGPSIYPVYWAIGWTPVRVAHDLLPDDPILVRRYWAESLAWLDPSDAIVLWNDLSQSHGDALDAGSYARYFDFLIAKEEYPEAKKLWNAIASKFYKRPRGEEGDLFWNGRFQHERAFNGGLEWRIPEKTPGDTTVRVAMAPGSGSERYLLIRFGGKENTAFSNVRHFFFVEPGATYRLAYHVRANDITTDNGPYVRIIVHGERSVVTKGKVAVGTGDWTFQDDFTVPASAQWAEIAICRDPSTKLNNRIQGDVWYGNFTLETVSAPPGGEEEKR